MILIVQVSSQALFFENKLNYQRLVDEQKALCQLLGQLHIEHGLAERSIHKLDILLSHHEDVRATIYLFPVV
jgi:hypothetical protein